MTPILFDDPQVAALGMAPVVKHPVVGKMRFWGVPIDFEKTPGRVRRAAPLLGEHTEELLGELGYGEERIEALMRDRAVLGRGRNQA